MSVLNQSDFFALYVKLGFGLMRLGFLCLREAESISYPRSKDDMFMNRKSFYFLLSFIVTILATTSVLLVTNTRAQTKIASSVDSSTNPLLQQSDIGNSSLNNNNTNGNILIRGIISSEPGQPEQLKVQRTIILPHRQDGNDYTGILTYTASRPVEVLLGKPKTT